MTFNSQEGGSDSLSLETENEAAARVAQLNDNPSVAQVLEEGDPSKLQALDHQYSVESPVTAEQEGPDAQGFYEKLNTSERRNEIQQEIASEIKYLANLLDAPAQNTSGVERAIRGISNNIDRMWQPRVRRELAHSTEFDSGEYSTAIVTPEAQSIYDEEINKIISSNQNPSVTALLDALKNRKIVDGELDDIVMAKVLINGAANKRIDTSFV